MVPFVYAPRKKEGKKDQVGDVERRRHASPSLYTCRDPMRSTLRNPFLEEQTACIDRGVWTRVLFEISVIIGTPTVAPPATSVRRTLNTLIDQVVDSNRLLIIFAIVIDFSISPEIFFLLGDKIFVQFKTCFNHFYEFFFVSSSVI